MRIIGDIHGKLNTYRSLGEGVRTIQVGDFGMGFLDPDEYEMLHSYFASGNHYFIRGNHDDPEMCKNFKGYIHDGSVRGDFMFVGGAMSTDRNAINPKDGYWENEQLTYGEFLEVFDTFEKVKPKVMITHDAPLNILKMMFNHVSSDIGSFTQRAFDHLWQNHKPELWIFGHHHLTKSFNCMGTEFVCLGELDYLDLGDKYEF